MAPKFPCGQYQERGLHGGAAPATPETRVWSCLGPEGTCTRGCEGHSINGNTQTLYFSGSSRQLAPPHKGRQTLSVNGWKIDLLGFWDHIRPLSHGLLKKSRPQARFDQQTSLPTSALYHCTAGSRQQCDRHPTQGSGLATSLPIPGHCVASIGR